MSEQYTFGGWATRYNVKCSDGRTILNDAFKHCDGQKVPLVWNHSHDDPSNVIGNAVLEHRDEGIYIYGSFNNTPRGQDAKEDVMHGDITGLSIYANRLKQRGPIHDRYVEHGYIREVSLVFATANPEAYIDTVLSHGDNSEDEEVIMYFGEEIELIHADQKTEDKEENHMAEEVKKDEQSGNEKTVKEVFDDMTEEQKAVVYIVAAEIAKNNQESGEDEDEDENEEVKHSEGGFDTMKRNVFDQNNNQQEDTLMHADIINDAIADARRFGSLRESILQHAAINNITDIGELFPMEKDLNMPPEWIKEDESWVAKIMNAVHHTPFSRVRALFAKMDEEEARAQGYIKGNEKDKHMKLAVLKRTTQPTTVYIKMAMDRDDVVDINDFDVVAWQRAEMRKQLDKELARAFLLGDGRTPGTDGKIDENCIVPVLTDNDMYTIKYTVTDGTDFHNDFNSASENDSEAKGVIRAAVKSRKTYKGSGKPTFFTTEDLLTELLLIEDQNGRRIYESEAALATAMRVKEIVTIPEMEKHTDIYGIIVNFNDYNTGADKGGSVNMFDDFDIDYNQLKYLMETRCSAALVKPFSAIVLKKANAAG